jgi:sec-independent protein translocase protein TatC
MGFIEHLEDLRKRLIRALLFLCAGTALCLIFSQRLVDFLTRPFGADPKMHLALLQPIEGFMVHLKVSLVAGIFLTSPLWLGQLWGFISPGLYSREKRVIIPVLVASVGAFIIGAAFGYWILPYAVGYFQSFSTSDIAVTWSLGRYIDFVLQLLLAFGLTFELPLIIYAAAMLGIVTPKTLRQYRRHAIIGILIVGGIITPPDVFSQIVVSVPLIVLYEISIIMSAIALKRRDRRKK